MSRKADTVILITHLPSPNGARKNPYAGEEMDGRGREGEKQEGREGGRGGRGRGGDVLEF